MIEHHPFHDLLPLQALALHRRAMQMTSNRHHAEDLVQETLQKAWANRDRFQPDSNLRAWLFTILRNTFFSNLRKVRHEVEDVDGRFAASMAEEPRQDHDVALKELIAAIALLPDVQRGPIVMIGAYGYSQLEAADAHGCTVGTIKSRVSRGRASLDRMLGHSDGLRQVRRVAAGRKGTGSAG